MRGHKYVVPLITFLLFTSCFTENNHGWPKNIYFSSEGESQVIRGNEAIFGITFYNGKYEDAIGFCGANAERDSIVGECQWLKISGKFPAEELELTVEPNESDKSRKMVLEGDYGMEYAVIKIIQAGR